MARGLNNNNPLNIRKDGKHWVGEKEPSTDKSFKQFISMAYGYRAAFVNLASYRERGLDTIDKIIRRWAPPCENNTESYIKHVEEWSGVPRHKILLKAGSKDDYVKIVCAMSRVENGMPAVEEDVRKGFALQSRLL